MQKSFEKWLEQSEKNLKKDPWLKKLSFDEYFKELISEVEELNIAFQNNDIENIKEELGDVFHDVLTLAFLAEKENKFKAKEIIDSVNKKIAWRKPFIFWDKDVSYKEAAEIYHKRKQIEKKKKN